MSEPVESELNLNGREEPVLAGLPEYDVAAVSEPNAESSESVRRGLIARYREVRSWTEQLCAPLHAEDYVVQSMPDASPAKWHLAHTSWFFETFVLLAKADGTSHGPPDYTAFHPQFGVLFNSYYEALGPRHPRPERGLITRPGVDEVYAYRRAIDAALLAWLERAPVSAELSSIIELGLAHEQQHQELLLTDVQHMLSRNPLAPVYAPLRAVMDAPLRAVMDAPLRAVMDAPLRARGDVPLSAAGYERFPGGLAQIGHAGGEFAFDNERPRHRVVCEPYELARRLVSCGEYLEFMRDGGYARPELWLSDGWRFVQDEALAAPLYWEERDHVYLRFSLHGTLPVDLAQPVCHVSFYEADAYARWAGARLPTEVEWELAYAKRPVAGQFADGAEGSGRLLPSHTGSPYGSAWTWTASPYVAYPGFVPEPGALGEYNGKFMCNQIVLRGGSCFTPAGHVRPTYRNFFPPTARWQVTGIRLAR